MCICLHSSIGQLSCSNQNQRNNLWAQKIDFRLIGFDLMKWKIKFTCEHETILLRPYLLTLQSIFNRFQIYLNEKRKVKRNEKCNRVATENCINKTHNMCYVFCYSLLLSFGIILYLFVEIALASVNHFYMAKMYSFYIYT